MNHDVEPLTIGLVNLAAGLLALTIAYVYTLPRYRTLPQDPAPVILAEKDGLSPQK